MERAGIYEINKLVPQLPEEKTEITNLNPQQVVPSLDANIVCST